ncbi:unnamed protein product [Cylicocyclus nassatus]|uniref:Microtubule-associated protein 9 n=1 Tax=Cylicocyclus nassatus TaxID=53992 RepID=A0AA36GYZ0_CYLNA|nr:unnamed protein product [Cylicocyclus nassatus]
MRNEIRRRSLVNLKDVKENQRVRQPSEITEEAEEDANNNSTSSKKLLSRPSTSESGGTYLLSPASKTDGPAKSPPKPPAPAPRNLPSTHAEEEKKTSRNAKDHPTPSTFTSASSQHDAWLKKKLEEERKRKARQRAEAAKKEEEEKERKENAKKLFERWKAERDEKAREERKQRRVKEKEKQQAEEEAKKQKLKEAEKTFEAWKRSHSRPRTSSSKSDLEKQKQKEEAKKEAEKAFEAWKRNKDKAELARKRELAEKEEVKRKQLEEEREYRELLAQQTYETWLELKENERLLAQSISSLNFSEPPPLPWLPPSNTCPRQFVPSSKNRHEIIVELSTAGLAVDCGAHQARSATSREHDLHNDTCTATAFGNTMLASQSTPSPSGQ